MVDDVTLLLEHFAQIVLATGYFAGVILAIVFWSRVPRAALFLLIAAGLMLGVELLYITAWMIPQADFLDDPDFSSSLNALDSLTRLIAFALLVAAIFAGRRPRKTTWLDEEEQMEGM